MTHKEKIDHFIGDMRRRGVGVWTAVPPAYRLALLLGISIRPPFFQSFATITVMVGSGWAIGFALIMHLLRWVPQGLPLFVEFVAYAMAGLLFGVTMAGYYKWRAKRFNL